MERRLLIPLRFVYRFVSEECLKKVSFWGINFTLLNWFYKRGVTLKRLRAEKLWNENNPDPKTLIVKIKSAMPVCQVIM
jgi:hypothetical protein